MRKQVDIASKLANDKLASDKRDLVRRINEHHVKQFELVMEYNDLFRQAFEKLKELWELGDIVIPDGFHSSGEIIKPFISIKHSIAPMRGLYEADIRAVNKLLPMGYEPVAYRKMIEELGYELSK